MMKTITAKVVGEGEGARLRPPHGQDGRGKIGVANWVPDGYVGDLFRTMGKYVPPPHSLKPPFRWGTEEGLGELLGEGVASLHTGRRNLVSRFPSARHHVEYMLDYYGPLNKAFGTLDDEQQEAFAGDLISMVERYNRAVDGTAVWRADYLEVVATKR
jgi:hypothetical protein